MIGIGEFSKMTGLTVKALRFYHREGVLEPARIDEKTGYRYYAPGQIEVARIVRRLRDLDFPVSDVAEIVGHFEDESDILEFLVRQNQVIGEKERRFGEIRNALEAIIRREQEAKMSLSGEGFEVKDAVLPPLRIAGYRMSGSYRDCGRGFAALGRKFGRKITGKARMLIYDDEYRENDADFEACFPVKDVADSSDGEGPISVRDLPGGRAATLMHRGPYEDLSPSYEKLLRWIADQGLQPRTPSREVYHKGPGMILKGNPQKYLTELQIPVAETGDQEG